MLLQSKEYVILASSRRPFATQYKIRCSFLSFVTERETEYFVGLEKTEPSKTQDQPYIQ